MKLYSYYRSSAAYRVRIALNLKGLPYTTVPINLFAGEQHEADFLGVNPEGRVPMLAFDDGSSLSQSLAIIEWLDETHRDPALLPADALQRAQVRALVNAIACDIHPLGNLSVLTYLREHFDADQAAIDAWLENWMTRGFAAVEQRLDQANCEFCLGPTPGLADIYLAPQVYNAHRFKIPMDAFPNINRVVDNCNKLDAFIEAAPEQQPDSV